MPSWVAALMAAVVTWTVASSPRFGEDTWAVRPAAAPSGPMAARLHRRSLTAAIAGGAVALVVVAACAAWPPPSSLWAIFPGALAVFAGRWCALLIEAGHEAGTHSTEAGPRVTEPEQPTPSSYVPWWAWGIVVLASCLYLAGTIPGLLQQPAGAHRTVVVIALVVGVLIMMGGLAAARWICLQPRLLHSDADVDWNDALRAQAVRVSVGAGPVAVAVAGSLGLRGDDPQASTLWLFHLLVVGIVVAATTWGVNRRVRRRIVARHERAA